MLAPFGALVAASRSNIFASSNAVLMTLRGFQELTVESLLVLHEPLYKRLERRQRA
jgi:hypothetical protein